MLLRIKIVAALALALSAAFSAPALAQQSSKAQAVIDQAAQDGKYAFVLFYKQNDAVTNAMNTTLQDSLANEADRAVMTFVQLGNAADQALIAKYDVGRAPMPLTLAIAPNGAMTGLFSQKLSAGNIQDAFVTPTMMQAMKALQAGKLVFVTVHGTGRPATPVALNDLQSDAHFSSRIVPLAMHGADPQEAKFVGQMQLDPNMAATMSVLLAPPGVLVGKFDVNASKADIAAVLANAGKCCDDPNCKHHQPSAQARGGQGTQRK